MIAEPIPKTKITRHSGAFKPVPTRFPSTNACQLLDRLVKEDIPGRETCQITAQNPRVAEMERQFARILSKNPTFHYRLCKRAIKRIKGLEPNDVALFSMLMQKFENNVNFRYNSGMFLSALINTCEGNDFTINISSLSSEVSYLCYRNVKNVKIMGDVGMGLQGGAITVCGNIGELGRFIKGGNIFQYGRQLVKDGEIIAQPENK